MKVILDINIICVDENYVYAMMRKQYGTQLVPTPDMVFEDSAWKDPRKAYGIVCNFDEGYYHLQMEDEEVQSRDRCEKVCEMYKLHGWIRLGERRR